MRAYFSGQNVFALGYGVAALQAPRLVMDKPAEPGMELEATGQNVSPVPAPVTNPPRLDPAEPQDRMTVM